MSDSDSVTALADRVDERLKLMARRFTGSTNFSTILWINGGHLSSSTVPVSAYPFTVSGWAKVADVSQVNPIMAFSDEGNANDSTIVVVYEERLRLLHGQNNSYATLETEVTDGEEFYWAIVCESATSQKLYKNGVLVDSSSVNVPFPAAYDRYYIGAEYRALQLTAHDATIALPTVHNVALTDGEIQRQAAGVFPLEIRPAAVAAFHGLFRAASPEVDLIGTNDLTVNTPGTGTAATASGPTISYDSPIYLESTTIDEGEGMADGNYVIDTITATVSSTAVTLETIGFTADNVAAAATAVICAQNAAVMVTRGANETPTPTHGLLINAGQTKAIPLLNGGSNLKLIRQGGDAMVTVELLQGARLP